MNIKNSTETGDEVTEKDQKGTTSLPEVTQSNDSKQNEGTTATNKSNCTSHPEDNNRNSTNSVKQNLQHMSGVPLRNSTLPKNQTNLLNDLVATKNNTNETSASTGTIPTFSKTEEVEKNITLLLVNFIRDVTNQNKSNVGIIGVLQKLCKSLNQPTSSNTERVLSPANQPKVNNRPQFVGKDVIVQPVTPNWSHILLQDMFSYFIRKSSVRIA